MKNPLNTNMTHSNVIDIFSGKTWRQASADKIIRLAPELDGLQMLYSVPSIPDQLFSLQILCWAIRANGDVVAMVPWLNKLVAADHIKAPLHGQWEGYLDEAVGDIFFFAPPHKEAELCSALDYYESSHQMNNDRSIIQEIPENLGTHAVMSSDDFETLVLSEVVSWRLFSNGEVSATLIDEDKVESTPILLGDPCLYCAETRPDFKYFFQHQIANRLKAQDPEAIAAVATLIEDQDQNMI